MKETIELRINYDYASLLFSPAEGRSIGNSVRVVEIPLSDPRLLQIPAIDTRLRNQDDRAFYFGWKIRRKYTRKELEAAPFFRVIINSVFGPAGEECGTVYDDAIACSICGTNGKQEGRLRLGKDSIPRKDIAKTIAGEVVVSDKFVSAFRRRKLRGALFSPIYFGTERSSYSQLIASEEIELAETTKAGSDPFFVDLGSDAGTFEVAGRSLTFEKEIYVCPKGHLIGLNILSELYLRNETRLSQSDLFSSVQKVGVRRGLLRPESVYVCSSQFRRMVIEEKLKGLEFEIARTMTERVRYAIREPS